MNQQEIRELSEAIQGDTISGITGSVTNEGGINSVAEILRTLLREVDDGDKVSVSIEVKDDLVVSHETEMDHEC